VLNESTDNNICILLYTCVLLVYQTYGFYMRRRILRTRRDEVTGEWRRLHNEDLNDLYSSPNIVRVIKSRRMRWVGHVTRMGEERGVTPEGKRPLGRPRR